MVCENGMKIMAANGSNGNGNVSSGIGNWRKWSVWRKWTMKMVASKGENGQINCQRRESGGWRMA